MDGHIPSSSLTLPDLETKHTSPNHVLNPSQSSGTQTNPLPSPHQPQPKPPPPKLEEKNHHSQHGTVSSSNLHHNSSSSHYHHSARTSTSVTSTSITSSSGSVKTDSESSYSSKHDMRPTPRLQGRSRAQLWGSRSVELFEKLEQIGEGTYGKVYMAKNKETSEIVALKKIRMDNEREGFPITAIREIKILKELHHTNIVDLKEIVTSKATKENKGLSSIYMVFEYMDHDLTGLMLNEGNMWRPSEAHIKCYMKQLLEGLHYCHLNSVLHRDIKGSNLLISNKGILKLADFGLARPFTEQAGKYTNRVITLWYRPPELLLGAEQYGPQIDIWSAGCILAELLANRAIFPGKNEIDQLEMIFRLCGTPNEQNWPDVVKLPWWTTFQPQREHKRVLRETFKMFPESALDLIDRMLTLDPSQRISAAEALDSDYFWTDPAPCKPSELPRYPSCHEFQAKKRRQQQQAQHEQLKRQKVTHGGPGGYNSAPRQNGRAFDNQGRPPYNNYGGSRPGPAAPYSQPPARAPSYSQRGSQEPHSQRGYPPPVAASNYRPSNGMKYGAPQSIGQGRGRPPPQHHGGPSRPPSSSQVQSSLPPKDTTPPTASQSQKPN